MDRQNVFDWLWTVNCLGCGNIRIWDIMDNFRSAAAARAALEDRGRRREFLSESERNSAERTSAEQINQLIGYCESRNIYILTFDDELYPERLRSIYNPPAVLFCRGDMSCLESDFSISVVGTRKPSDYSVRVTSALVRELCSFGITIVSGFAVGIDITANLSAARCGGKTIAVLGCGLDRDYPKENVQYRSEIERNGLFISEYYPLAGGTRASFPARNRILSGLSLGTVVSEAAVKSGALITANLALSQGKDIFALAPHDLFDKRYGGNVALIRDGAVCLCGVKDIVYEYYENYGHKIANTGVTGAAMPAAFPDGNASDAYKQALRIDPLAEDESKTYVSSEQSQVRENEYDASALEGDEAKVYGLLKEAGKPLLADELSEMCGMDISEMLMLLTDLELNGAVISAAGQSYTVC
ncbi:MAG: DNA-protecting protein DprA [Oscillospiraceae bacterium]|jgi:DNA processing protein|nr:DNA-protecting protein DprA [Oscillospiraceae bacterium]